MSILDMSFEDIKDIVDDSLNHTALLTRLKLSSLTMEILSEAYSYVLDYKAQNQSNDSNIQCMIFAIYMAIQSKAHLNLPHSYYVSLHNNLDNLLKLDGNKVITEDMFNFIPLEQLDHISILLALPRHTAVPGMHEVFFEYAYRVHRMYKLIFT